MLDYKCFRESLSQKENAHRPIMSFDFFIFFSSFVVIFCSAVYIMAYRERRAVKTIGTSYPNISIIVPVWNEEKTLEDTIDALLRLRACYRGDMEIIVIDDNSSDNSLSIARSYEAAYSCVRCFLKDAECGQGKSESLNQGIAAAVYDIVGCVDADSYPEPEALNHMAEEFRDPRVGAVTTKLVVNKPKKAVEWFQQIEYVFSNFTLMAFDSLDAIYITRGPLSLYRKDVMQRINGFLPTGVTPTEDMEITFRIRKAGYTIRGSKKARVYTSVMKSWRSLFWQRMRWNRGTVINMWMHRDIFFDSRYGMLSMFILPTASLMICMVGVIIIYLVCTIGAALFTKGQELYYIFSSGYYSAPQLFSMSFLSVQEGGLHNLFLFAAVMAMYVTVNGFGFWESGEPLSVKYIFFAALTPFVYSPVILFFWMSAIIMQIGRKAVRWR